MGLTANRKAISVAGLWDIHMHKISLCNLFSISLSLTSTLAAAPAISAVQLPGGYSTTIPAATVPLITTVISDPDGRIGDNFGYSVALSADGSTALIGAFSAHLNGVDIGKAYIYSKINGVWSATPSAVFENPDTITGEGGFGVAVALSADGSVAVIGAPPSTLSPTASSKVYVFTRINDSWSLTPVTTFISPNINDCFGSSVALSADGKTTLIGAPCTTINGNDNSGEVYVFSQSGGIWSPTPVTTFSDPGGVQGDFFGWSVALSGDGNTALIGTAQGFGQGRAFIYTSTNGIWGSAPIATLDDPPATNDNVLGLNVALSNDGSIALIGAPNANNNAGTAYLFTSTNDAWNLTPTAIFDDPRAISGDNFGVGVALSGDGNTALMIGTNANEVFIFTRTNGLWNVTPAANLNPGQNFSTSVALSFNGSTALVGTPQTPPLTPPPPYPVTYAGGPGQAYIFESSNGWSNPPPSPPPGGGGDTSKSGGGGALGWLSLVILEILLCRRRSTPSP